MGQPSPLELDEIGPVFDRLLVGPLALAVSGGADSMALMHLVAAWSAGRTGPRPLVLTVDHGLRPGSGDEAAWVGHEAQRLGLVHATLPWIGAKPASGLQAAARDARYSLMSDYLDREVRDGALAGKRAIVTAHHADDQAETFLMRLGRGSGLDGLSGMRQRETLRPGSVEGTGCTILRPLLHVPKARLIATLEKAGSQWREDPSNASSDFERVRVRDALGMLDDVGIDATRIALSARRLARAREMVAAAAADAARRVQLNDGIFARVEPHVLSCLPDEIRIRVLAAVLEAFGGLSPPPRLSQIEELATAMAEPGRRPLTLGGCRIASDTDGALLIWRESGREGLPRLDLQPGAGQVWDRRFAVRLAGSEAADMRVQALGGEGVRHIARTTVLPRAPAGALETLAAFWREGRLIAVPTLKWAEQAGAGCSAQFVAAGWPAAV